MNEVFTKESYLAALEAAKELPEHERHHAAARINDEVNRQWYPGWDEQKERMVRIEGLPVKGSALSYGELCRQRHIDWRSGAPIPCGENQG